MSVKDDFTFRVKLYEIVHAYARYYRDLSDFEICEERENDFLKYVDKLIEGAKSSGKVKL
jgi:hypothetical protein